MSDRDAAMYILDEVITKSLQVDVSDKFDTFVKVLLEFEDDDTAVALGKQLMERLPPDSQARIQQKISGDQFQGGPPPGVFPQQTYPQQGFPQQQGYQQHPVSHQQPVYPQTGYPNPAGYQQPGYPSGYPPQQQGYPPQQHGYPPQQQGYPQQQPGYPPQLMPNQPPGGGESLTINAVLIVLCVKQQFKLRQ